MIRRLIEADRIACRDEADPGQVAFWLREGRTPELLIDLARSHRELAREITIMARPLLSAVIEEDEPAIENGLAEEERSERALDRAYWTPLKRELEELRHACPDRPERPNARPIPSGCFDILGLVRPGGYRSHRPPFLAHPQARRRFWPMADRIESEVRERFLILTRPGFSPW